MNGKTFPQWMDDVRKLAVTREFGFSPAAARSFDAEAWRMYFNDGMTPDEALMEDLSAGGRGSMKIHLGFEIGSGKAVEIPVAHLCVTGQTQQSGKTTTLEALITRSGRPAIAFVTKRAEGSFHGDVHRIAPYFRERADWQFVEAIMEAAMRERMKFQRPWIMRVARGAKTLADVAENVRQAIKTAKGLNLSVYEELQAYLELVLPQLERLPYSETVKLLPGLNVCDLQEYSGELQALVIRSFMEWVLDTAHDVISVVPEAWEFLPQKRGGPVKLAGIQLARKGAAARNFLWLDSQDIAGVDKEVLRAVSVWILGVQREANEVKRTLEHIPIDNPKPKVKDVMTLRRGEFFVCYAGELKRVYVQPSWLSAGTAAEWARGKMHEEDFAAICDAEQKARQGAAVGKMFKESLGATAPARGRGAHVDADAPTSIEHRRGTGAATVSAPTSPAPEPEEEDEVYREQYEEEKRKRLALELAVRRLSDLVAQLTRKEKAVATDGHSAAASPARANQFAAVDRDSVEFAEVVAAVREALVKEPAFLRVMAEQPQLEVAVTEPTMTVDRTSLRGRMGVLLADGFFNDPKTASAAHRELHRRGWGHDKRSVYREADAMAELGFLFKEGGGYLRNPIAKVRTVRA